MPSMLSARSLVIGCVLLLAPSGLAAKSAVTVTVLSPGETDSLLVGTTHQIRWRCRGVCDRMRVLLLRRHCPAQCHPVWLNGRLIYGSCGQTICRLAKAQRYEVRPKPPRLSIYSWDWRIPRDQRHGVYHVVVEPASSPTVKSAQRLAQVTATNEAGRGASDAFLVSDKRIIIDRPRAGEEIKRATRPYSIRFRVEGPVTSKLSASVLCPGGKELVASGVDPKQGKIVWERPGFPNATGRGMGPRCNRIIIENSQSSLFRVSSPFRLVP
jgi:hypothetical protein